MIITSSNEDIIDMVVNGDYHEFEPEKLRGLMKILPEMDEVSLDDDTNGWLDGAHAQMNMYPWIQFEKDFHQSLNWIFICPIRGSMKILLEMDEVKLDIFLQLRSRFMMFLIIALMIVLMIRMMMMRTARRWIYIARNVHEHDMWDSVWQSWHRGGGGSAKKNSPAWHFCHFASPQFQLMTTVSIFWSSALVLRDDAENEQQDDEIWLYGIGMNILRLDIFQIEMLKSWEGDMKKLGNAERFLLQLIDVKK